MNRRQPFTLLVCAALVFAACGSDAEKSTGGASDLDSVAPADASGSASAPADASGSASAPAEASGSASAPAEDEAATTVTGAPAELCGTTDAAFENLATGTTFSPHSTGAVSLEGGAAYTIYLADFDIDTSALSMFSTPEPTADQHMVTVAITTFNAEGAPEIVEPGRVIDYQNEFGELTFIVTANEGEEYFGNNTDATGSLTVTAVGDSLCFDIEYSDAEKTFSGSVATPVKNL